ncbi:MAG: 3'(2'),5'-bisphosphate nucleotidase CysQ [Neomegalonema sp.]
MPPSEDDKPSYQTEQALLIEAVRDAAPIALSKFRLGQTASAESWSKSHDNSIVTETDLAVNAALRDVLLGARPDYGWLSEEDADSPQRREQDRVFIVDPIDGTRSFAEGKPEFCFSVALVEAGRPIAAVIFAPALNALFAATDGGGATLNREPIQVSSRERLDGSTALGAKRSFHPDRWPGGAPEVARSYIHPIAYRLCMIAEGRWDLALTLNPTNEWDVAAGDLLIREAGGAVSDSAGAQIVYNKLKPGVGSLIAAPTAIHAEVITRLRPTSA